MITLKDIKDNPTIKAYITQADTQMDAIGYTEHSFRHAQAVADMARQILLKLNYTSREAELAAIAGYLHDIGNVISRSGHSQSGALIVMRILEEMKMRPPEIATICGAIGNHEEDYGDTVSNICSAVIIADKADVHKSRVRNPNTLAFDIHDRINYSAEKSSLSINPQERTITLELEINTEIAPVMEYFEIFLQRMIASRRAAKFLGCEFKLIINKVKLL